MCYQVDHRFFEVAVESNVRRNLPDLHRTVLRSAGDDVVVVRTPLNVKYRGAMTGDQRGVAVYSADLATTTAITSITTYTKKLQQLLQLPR